MTDTQAIGFKGTMAKYVYKFLLLKSELKRVMYPKVMQKTCFKMVCTYGFKQIFNNIFYYFLFYEHYVYFYRLYFHNHLRYRNNHKLMWYTSIKLTEKKLLP